MPPLLPPWAQNGIQKRALILFILHKSVLGVLIGGASCRVFPFEHQLTTFPHLEKWDIMLRFFLWNTYSQHCPMFKNVVAWRVPEHLLPTFPYDKKCDIVPRLFHFQIYSRVFIFSTSPDVIPLCSILHMHISRSIFQTDRKLSARDSARVFLVYIYRERERER